MNYPILDSIGSEKDLKNIPVEMLPQLCSELRSMILDVVSKNGGHLASSLGAVELIVALHRVFDLPDDKIIFDVGHQAYAHKILTGRREQFSSLRMEGGISGFPKREESAFDVFDTGHASTSISAGLGLMRGERMNGSKAHVVCLVGDGALTGGLAYEALDDVGESRLPLIVILNDNEMSISKNVGALSKTLSHLRTSSGYTRFKKNLAKSLDYGVIGRFVSKHLENFKNRVKRFILSNTFFEELGLTYLGPIDGHDINSLIKVFSEARELGKPVLVHTVTKKGKGYKFAELDPQKFHGVGPFNIETGELIHPHSTTCSDVFSQTLCKIAEENESVCAVTAAMPQGTGLDKFERAFPKRFYDVGIAEEHAVTMSAGLAAAGKRPVVAIYSSFIQRATDELFHDVCLQNLPVVFAVDRAGLVGQDGETHHGLMDVALFMNMPNLHIFAPSSFEQLKDSLRFCLDRSGPSLIRYNRGSLPESNGFPFDPYVWGVSKSITDICVLSYGALLEVCAESIRMIGEDICLIDAHTVKPLDNQLLKQLDNKGVSLIVAEEGPPVLAEKIALQYSHINVRSVSIADLIVHQGTVEEQRTRCGIDALSICKVIKETMRLDNK